MRKVVLSFWLSLDGYSCDEGSELFRLTTELPDDERQDEFFSRQLRQAGTQIMGRNTYQSMAAFWPGQDTPVAKVMNDVPKVVFSRTLQSAGWPQSRIASGDTAAEIARLKAEAGGDIVAHGGVQFVRSLIRLGLVDEYHLHVLPFAIGQGQPLFTGIEHPLPLRLLESTGFSSGLLELVYAPPPVSPQDPTS